MPEKQNKETDDKSKIVDLKKFFESGDEESSDKVSRDFVGVAGKDTIRNIDEEARTVELAFSSEEPYERWWGTEILDHSNAKSMRLGRLKDGAALLVNHSFGDQVGVVESARIDSDGVGRAVVRFGKSKRAKEIFTDVVDGIRKLVSVGYRIHEMVLEKQSDDGDSYRVTDWEPYEISIVSVPADPSVGVGRSQKSIKKEAIVPEVKEEKDLEVKSNNSVDKVDVSAVQKEARKSEMERIREITAIADEFDTVTDIRELKDQHIDGDLTVDSMRQAVLAKMGEQRKASVVSDASRDLGLSDNEVRQFSWVRAMAVVANPNDAAARAAAGFELEVSRAVEEATGDSTAGLFVSDDILRSQRAMNVTINATGGAATVDTDLRTDSFIDLLRNQSIVNRMGAMVLTGLVGDLAFPRQNGGGTMAWITPEGQDASETDQSIDQVPMSPKQAGCFTSYTRRIFKQSSIDIDAFIQRDLQQVMALGIDKAALYGTGAGGQPTGLMNVTGVGAVAFGVAGAPTYAELVALETAIAVSNADVAMTQTAVNPTMRGTLKTTQKFAGTNGQPVWGDANTVNGYGAAVSNQVAANDVIHGNWNDLMIGMWGGLDLMINPFTKAKSGGVDIIVLQDIDTAVRQPVSFVVGQ